MPRIFISYRRSDSADVAGRLYEKLTSVLGKRNVFKDVDGIPLGSDFRAVIERKLIDCDVMLVIIGRDWLTVTDHSGKRRLDSPEDFVRIEVELGIRHRNVQVIPVLVNNAQMPAESDLPARLQLLVFQNAAVIRNDPDFDRDVDRLIRALAPRPRWWRAALGAAVLIIAAITIFLIANNIIPPTANQTPTVVTTEAPVVAQNPTTALPPSVTYTPTATPSATASPLPPTPTYSETDIENTVTAEMGIALHDGQSTQTADALTREASATNAALETAAILTATATQWTPTPTLDARGTASARLTQTQSIIDATATADSWTDTPTPTFTPSRTPTLTPTPTATPIPLGLSLVNPVTSNSQWRPYIETYADESTGVEMVLVPAGCFQMGNDPNTAGWGGDEDGGRQCLEPFWIDRYEVTNGQFEQFDGQAANDGAFNGDDRPRELITWFEARDFCEVRGARLPTEAEWEYAARGVDQLYYPWGNRWDQNKVIGYRNSSQGTVDVGSHPDGASWVGAYDLSGNVWEWVNSAYQDYPYSELDGRENLTTTPRVLRGGSWVDLDAVRFRTTYRDVGNPSYGNGDGGFRCARSYGS